MLRAGELNTPVKLLAKLYWVNGEKNFNFGLASDQYEEITDDCGAPTNEYAVWKMVRGKVQIGSGREFYGAKKINNSLEGIIQIRMIPGITSDMRVMVDGQIYELIAPPIIAGQKPWERYIELHVRRVT